MHVTLDRLLKADARIALGLSQQARSNVVALMDAGHGEAAPPAAVAAEAPADGAAADPLAFAQQQQQMQQDAFQRQHQFVQMQRALEQAANQAADQQAAAADGNVTMQRVAQQLGGMATILQAMQTNQSMLQQQSFQQSANAAHAQATAMAAMQAATQPTQPHTPFTPRKEKIPVPTLPDPAEDFDGFMRQYDEFVFQWQNFATEWDLAKAVKDALPQKIRQDFELSCSVADITCAKIIAYLKENYQTEFETRQLQVLQELNSFQRTTSSLREYIRQFELLLTKCTSVNHRVDNRDLLLISKAQLTPEVQSEVLRHINSYKAFTGQPITYAQLKQHLLTYEGTNAFVRVNVAEQQDVNWQQRDGGYRRPYGGRKGDRRPSPYGGWKGKGDWSRGRSPSRTSTGERCRQFLKWGNCSWGDQCKFVHERSNYYGDADGNPRRSPSRGRDARPPSSGRDGVTSPARFGSRSPKGKGKGKSRSPKGRGKGKSRSPNGSPRRFDGQAAGSAGRGHPSRSPGPGGGGRPSHR